MCFCERDGGSACRVTVQLIASVRANHRSRSLLLPWRWCRSHCAVTLGNEPGWASGLGRGRRGLWAKLSMTGRRGDPRSRI